MDKTIYGVEIGHICIGDYAAVIYKSIGTAMFY